MATNRSNDRSNGQEESHDLGDIEDQNAIHNQSMDSSLPSAVQPRYQVYPIPPSGVRSLIGGTVALDGESVQVNSVHNMSRDEHEIIFEHESVSTTSRSGPPSFVNISHDLSSIGASMYESFTTFKILGKAPDSSPLSEKEKKVIKAPPPNIRTNQLAAVKTPSGQIVVTPSTDHSLASSAYLSPVKEIAIPNKSKGNENGSLPSTEPTDDAGTVQRCCPFWLQRTPLWLRLCMVGSLLFFLASTSLIAVAVAMAVKEGGQSDNSSSAAGTTNERQPPATTQPTIPSTPISSTSTGLLPLPTTSTVSTSATTSSATSIFVPPSEPTVPETEQPSPSPMYVGVTNAPVGIGSTLSPVVENPTFLPTTLVPTISPATATPTLAPVSTFGPTVPWDNTVTTFFLTAGVWDASVDPSVVLPRMPIQERGTFIVHLGNWNPATNSSREGVASYDCSTERYEQQAQLWSQSTSPVYFVVGHAETNGCENQANALRDWRQNLVGYHDNFWRRPRWTYWDDEWTGYPEMWVFDTNGVIVCGLHLTAGSITAEPDNARRPVQAAALEWIDINFDYYRNDRFRLYVIIANAPVNDPAHANFFGPFLERLRDEYSRMNFLWVQPGNASSLERDFQNVNNLDALTIVSDSWPPARIQIDRNFNLLFNQDNWFDEFTGLRIST